MHKRESKLAQLISDKENDITEMVSIKYQTKIDELEG